MKSLPYKGKFIVSQTFLNPSSRYASGVHLGVDLVGLFDKNIYAIQDGTVVFNERDSAFGNTVIIRQSGGLYCRYSHLQAVNVRNGQNVISGKTSIGLEGKTGYVIGGEDPRHLDLRISKVPYHTDQVDLYHNPCDYLGFPNRLYFEVTPEASNIDQKKNIILCKSEIDKRAAGYLADHLQCKIIDPDLLPASVLDQVFVNVYVIGSPEKPISKAINIYGNDRFETCQKVLDLISKARNQADVEDLKIYEKQT